MKRLLLPLFCAFLSLSARPEPPTDPTLQPKLIVGVVIDQMREDYLYRFYEHYSEGGFRRLMRQGMNFTYAHYNYTPTYTGPGHSSIYTGTTPYYHGIISNDWYDKELKKPVYCAGDTWFKTVGAENESGQMSPRRLLASTLSDELRMSNNGLSRVFAASLKDRGSILPGGHMANAAYWYDGKSGNFVTSTYYLEKLPGWVNKFNRRLLPEALMASDWNLKLPLGAYKTSQPDDGPGESDPFGEGKTTFPHLLAQLSVSDKWEAIRSTPFGNQLLTDFAISLLQEESLGKGNYTDMLAISYSSTDYVGHAYGPNSMEIMDTYIRMDLEIERLLKALDEAVGTGNYVLFLTADHGVKPNADYLNINKMPVGTLSSRAIQDTLRAFCKERYQTPGLIEVVYDNQVYYNQRAIDSLRLDLSEFNNHISRCIRNKFPTIGPIFTQEGFQGQTAARNMQSYALNGTHPYRSGDLSFELTMNHLGGGYSKGTTHGASYDYDSHVPLLFYGWHVPPGESNEEVYIEDI
ncbi:MAG: alkaline phosphatase family protein, partial [Bacteroidetes bacterium]